MCRLTPKQLRTHGCVISTAATDAQVLKHQSLSIPSADETFIGSIYFLKKNALSVNNMRK